MPAYDETQAAAMKLTRAAWLASVTTVVLWVLKAVVIAIFGEGNSVLESVLFLMGLAACVVATVLVGAALFVRRSAAWRVLGAVLAFVGVAVVGGAVQAAVVAVQPSHPAWWWGELNLWAIMLALLAGAVVARRRADGAVSTSSTSEGLLPADR